MLKLNQYDRNILYGLDKKSNIQLSDLAKKIKKSKQFVLYRIKRLEDEGIITSYTAIIDMTKLGYFSFRIYFNLQQTTKVEENAFVEFIKKKYPQVWTITSMHGKWDFALFLGVKSIAELHQIWDGIMLEFKKNIKTYNVAVYAPVHNFNRTFFLNVKDEPITRTYGDGELIQFDELDWKIIKEYAPSVRTPSIEIARKLKVTGDTIRARIRRLEKKEVICGYKIGLDLTKLGYTSYRLDLQLISTKKNSQIFEYCKQHKNIYQINKSIGGADFEVEVVVKDLQNLLVIINEMKTMFKDVINDVEYFGFTTFHILNYIPD
jgi:Lrp/AsnC family transcriptional regulator, leucine-responsive regulatory protein